MELLSNLSFIEAAAEQLISSKCCLYNVALFFQQINKYPSLKNENIQVINPKTGETFNAFFITSKQNITQPCIVYLHGLSSYCFQGHFLFQYIQNNYSLCLYDLRSHGKNKNPLVTYGLKQAEDLYFMTKRLALKGVKQFYLWGRSMGASTILHFLNIYGHEDDIKSSVKYAILDSPFSSFEKIAKETTAKSLKIPHFICSPLVSIALNRILQKYKVDLKVINFQNLKSVKYPAIFIYSERDEVVNYQHSNQIIEGYGGKLHTIKGQFLHNQPRPNDIMQKVFKQIKTRKHTISKSNLTGRQTGQRKGLSISLISSKNFKQQKQNCSPYLNYRVQKQEQDTKRQISPKTFIKMNQNYCNLPTEMISFSIKRRMMKEKTKITTSHKVLQLQQRSKSKNKGKFRHVFLSNTRYI